MSIDTPDYQRGVVSAQKLLATVAGTDSTVTVGVPPNAEALVVTCPAFAQFSQAVATGVTTGINYAGQQAAPRATDPGSATWFFDVSEAVDAQVKVDLGAAPGATWYVYSDAATHTIVDLSARADDWGHRYVIPVAPSVTAGDHPLVEMRWVGGGLTSPATLVGAPPAGQRTRLMSAQTVPFSGGMAGYLADSASGQIVVACSETAGGYVNLAPSGLALAEGATVDFTPSAGSGVVICAATFTVEVI